MKSRSRSRRIKRSKRSRSQKLRLSLAETTSKYTNRPSPPYKANEYCGETMKGNDGEMYLSKKVSGGVCRWVPVDRKRSGSPRRGSSKGSHKKDRSSFSGKKYKTLDNGGEPFLVTINGNDVEVTINEKEDPKYGKKVYSVKAEKIFVGDPKPFFFDDYYNWKKGTSVLLKIGPEQYVFIGDTIYKFSVEKGDTIVKYYTPTGSSAVPYPYAVGKNNTYLMTSDKDIIPHELYNPKEEEPYSFFWSLSKKDRKRYKQIKTKEIYKRLY